jgi:hypothetical protein
MQKILSKWYESGRLQQLFTYLVFLVAAFLFALMVEFICTDMVLGEADRVLAEYVPNDQIAQVKIKLTAAGGGFGPQLFLIALFMAITIWALMKVSTRLNLVGPVTLDKALRFDEAMQRLGLVHEWEQLQFVRHYKISLYIATQPLLTDEAEAVKAGVYPFVRTLLASTDYMAAEKGRKRLCLRTEDLEAALAQIGQGAASSAPTSEETPASLRDLQAQVANLEMEKKVLQSQFVESNSKIQELEALNSQLKSELQIHARKEGKDDKAQKRLFLYSLGLAPIFQAIVANKPDRRDVTRGAFSALFKASLNDDAVLKSLLLGIGECAPDELPDYICHLAWDFLKSLELTNISGPAPTGSQARLKKLIFGG